MTRIWHFRRSCYAATALLTGAGALVDKSAASGAQTASDVMLTARRTTRPVAMRVEDRLVPSPFYTTLNERTYGDQRASVALRKAAANTAEFVLSELLTAITQGDTRREREIQTPLAPDS